MTDNALPAGVTESAVLEALRRSGYPLQSVVAAYLHPTFDVVEEWGYVDRDTKQHRSLDVHAYKSLLRDGHHHFHPDLAVLIECKRSELPYVFFRTVVARAPYDFPLVAGFLGGVFELHKQGAGYLEVGPAQFLKLHDLPFATHPPLCNAFARTERKGDTLLLSVAVPVSWTSRRPI